MDPLGNHGEYRASFGGHPRLSHRQRSGCVKLGVHLPTSPGFHDQGRYPYPPYWYLSAHRSLHVLLLSHRGGHGGLSGGIFRGGAFTKFLRLAIRSLAGVPSVVFGLFGLSFFCIFLGFGSSLLAAGLTLGCLALR